MQRKHFDAFVRYVEWKNQFAFEHRRYIVHEIHADAQHLFLAFGRNKPSYNYYEQLFECNQKEPTQEDYNQFILYTIPFKYKF